MPNLILIFLCYTVTYSRLLGKIAVTYISDRSYTMLFRN